MRFSLKLLFCANPAEPVLQITQHTITILLVSCPSVSRRFASSDLHSSSIRSHFREVYGIAILVGLGAGVANSLARKENERAAKRSYV